MLIEHMPEHIISAYNEHLSGFIPRVVEKFLSSPDDVSAKELSKVMQFASSDGALLRSYQKALNGTPTYYQLFEDGKTGKKIDGFFEMDKDFLDFALNREFLSMPCGNGFGLMTIAGVADSIEECLGHTNLLTNRHGTANDYFGLCGKEFIVRVEECSDFNVFNSLYHVGQWGIELGKTSYFALIKETNKYLRTIRSENPKKSTDMIALYSAMDERTSLKEKSRYSNSLNNRDLFDLEQYFQAYREYKRANKSFILFEIFVVNKQSS